MRTNPEASRLFCLEIVRGAPLIGPELRTSLKELVDAKAAAIRSWSETGRLAPVEPYHLIFTIWSTTQQWQSLGFKTVAIATLQSPFPQEIESYVKAALKGTDIKVVASEQFAPDIRDMTRS